VSNKKELFELVNREMVIGVVREDTAEDAWHVAQAYARSGIRLVEITLTTPDALGVMARLLKEFGDRGVVVAAGTVRNSNDAASARRAGASILVSPHTTVPVLEYATEHDMLGIAGAATPTEIIHAWESGADIVKVFPALHLGGPAYIRTLRGPIRDVPMLAGGPIPLEAIDSYLDAGVMAVNLGASLAVPDLVEGKSWDEIGRRALLARSIVRSRHSVEVDPESVVH